MEDQNYIWGIWQDAFCKFGYGDGGDEVSTALVAAILEQAGYDVRYGQWGCHNLLIYSIMRDGVELIPKSAVGYQRPEYYLTEEIINLLNKAFTDGNALSAEFSAFDQEPY